MTDYIATYMDGKKRFSFVVKAASAAFARIKLQPFFELSGLSLFDLVEA